MGVKSVPLGSLGLNGLLQLQKQNVDVSKELRGLGREDLIAFTDVGKAIQSVQGVPHSPVNKYHVSPKEMRTEDGITFDSKLERAAYVLLRDRGVDFDIHPRFDLQDKFTDTAGNHIRAIVYEADFLIRGGIDGEYICDMKGMCTPEFLVKRKLFMHKYKRQIHCQKNIPSFLTFLIENKIMAQG